MKQTNRRRIKINETQRNVQQTLNKQIDQSHLLHQQASKQAKKRQAMGSNE